jgi:hypothetical protein
MQYNHYYDMYSRLILKTASGENTYPMNAGTWHTWEVKIPDHISCEQCILQVYFVTRRCVSKIHRLYYYSYFTVYYSSKCFNAYQIICSRLTGKLEIMVLAILIRTVPTKNKNISLHVQTYELREVICHQVI